MVVSMETIGYTVVDLFTNICNAIIGLNEQGSLKKNAF